MLIRALCPASWGWWWKCTIKKRFYTRCPVPGWCDCSLPHSPGSGGQESALSRGIELYTGFVWAPNAVPHVMSFGFGPHHAKSFLPNLLNTLWTIHYICLGWFPHCHFSWRWQQYFVWRDLLQTALITPVSLDVASVLLALISSLGGGGAAWNVCFSNCWFLSMCSECYCLHLCLS